ncbi:MAG: hypothetical protein ABFR63_10110 [Thermodesulfobacteriota bacterium]
MLYEKSKLVFSIIELLLLTMLMVIVPSIISIDAVVIGGGIPENSATEYVQEVLILFSSILFGIGALRYPESRGFFVLVAGLFGCMFIRELDAYLDAVTHGFWLYPTLLLAFGSILYSIRCRGNVTAPMAEYTETKSFVYVAIGILIVLVFSRIFGTGHLWREVMGSHYHSSYKAIIQEGLELVGYALIFFGSAMFFLQKVKAEKESVENEEIR